MMLPCNVPQPSLCPMYIYNVLGLQAFLLVIGSLPEVNVTLRYVLKTFVSLSRVC